jgi:D-serine deaminase-like pyridoxal phosphate-dependent protein
MALAAALQQADIPVGEVITSGTPATPSALSYAPFRRINHCISPGTPVYGDMTSLTHLPAEWGCRPAALVLADVCSRPLPTRVTVDAGHKAVSADMGVPTCAVVGHADWQPHKPSEEHLPIDLPAGTPLPEIGTQLYLLPRHICPTVNNFDAAAIIADGRVIAIEPVSARGHEVTHD